MIMVQVILHHGLRSIHPSRQKHAPPSLALVLLLLVVTEKAPIAPVEGWSQIHFIKNARARTNAFASVRSSLKESSNVVLGTSPGNNRDFFEDPSLNMTPDNSTLAAAGLTSNSMHMENILLKDSIRRLEEENERLKRFVEQKHEQDMSKRLVLETFEGEGLFDSFEEKQASLQSSSSQISISDEAEEDDELWCDVLDGNECPVEPTISFGQALRDRAYWLVGLLIMQSLSGIILSRNELLLANHPVIIYYLTMMVGAGGNAGNQASVRVIRGIALGTLNERTRGQFLVREFKMAATLSVILSVAGFCRTIFFKTPFPEAVTVTAALSLIVFSSICLGAVLPLILERIGVDPAHSSTTIQVIMDILGVLLAVVVSGAILDGPLGAFLLPKLGYN